jgi:hypothetical protein
MGKRAWKVVYLLIECGSINEMSKVGRVGHNGSIKALAKSEMSEGEWERVEWFVKFCVKDNMGE